MLARHVGVPLNIQAVETDLATVGGLDRYETVTWRLTRDAAQGYGLRVVGRVKTYAPPFFMLGVNLENTTSSDFRITLTGRYLAFDVIGSGSELRIDGTLGSNPSLASELYRPIGSTALFVAPFAGVGTETFNFIVDDAVVARYGQTQARLGLNLGVNLGARSDLRLGAYVGRSSASIEVGDPGFPELEGKQTGAQLVWRLDTQDATVAPRRGILANVELSRLFTGPDITVDGETFDYEAELTQLSMVANKFWSRGPRNRVFVYGGLGTSFNYEPLPTNEFTLGSPFRLGAYSSGRTAREPLLRAERRRPASGGAPAGLHGRSHLRRSLARERRRVRRLGPGRLAIERRHRSRDGHARGAGHDRRVVGLRRPLAHVRRGWTDVPVPVSDSPLATPAYAPWRFGEVRRSFSEGGPERAAASRERAADDPS